MERSGSAPDDEADQKLIHVAREREIETPSRCYSLAVVPF
jgi:hypothetical protein